MDRELFIRAGSEVRVSEKKFLPKAVLERMAESPELSDAMQILGDTVYADHFSLMKREQDYEIVLKSELDRFYDRMKKICPVSTLFDFMALKYEFHNLKTLAKEIVSGEDFSDIYMNIGTYDFKALKNAYKSGAKSLKGDEYFKLLKEVDQDYADKKDPQRIDLILDGYYFIKWKKMADEMDNELISLFVRDTVNFTNVKILIRAKARGQTIARVGKLFVEGGSIAPFTLINIFNEDTASIVARLRRYGIGKSLMKALELYNETQTLNVFEQMTENRQMEIIESAKRISYGPEVLFAFMVAKELEIKNLRIILASKLAGLPSESAKNRLRDTYV